MFEQANFRRLALLERQAPALFEQFAQFFRIKELISQRYPAGSLETLTATKVDDHTAEVTYLNTTVRFQLLITFNKHNRTTGRVVCLNKIAVNDEVHYDYLGEFGFEVDGTTTLPENPEFGLRTMRGNIDEVVIGYLDKAIEQGPNWLAKALQATASLEPKI